jgi:hypothetical protein
LFTVLGFHLWLHIKQDADSFHYSLYQLGRVLHRPYFSNLILRNFLNLCEGTVESRDDAIKLLLRLISHVLGILGQNLNHFLFL